MDLGEVGWRFIDWIGLLRKGISGDLVNMVMNFRVPLNAGKFLSACTTCGLSSVVS
jgi:hypothetical protein